MVNLLQKSRFGEGPPVVAGVSQCHPNQKLRFERLMPDTHQVYMILPSLPNQQIEGRAMYGAHAPRGSPARISVPALYNTMSGEKSLKEAVRPSPSRARYSVSPVPLTIGLSQSMAAFALLSAGQSWQLYMSNMYKALSLKRSLSLACPFPWKCNASWLRLAEPHGAHAQAVSTYCSVSIACVLSCCSKT